MRIANLDGRLIIVAGDGIDVEIASRGRFSHHPSEIYERWDEFYSWAKEFDGDVPGAEVTVDMNKLGAPSPRPAQVFAVGGNYRDHVEEAGVDLPKTMEVFTKYPSCVTGPNADLPLPTESVDWEAELVVIIGRRAHHVAPEDSWKYVAGVTAGQDFTCRASQFAGSQFSLSKSFPAFGPTGPWLQTLDEVDDPDNMPIQCSVNGEQVQKGSSIDQIYSSRDVISRLSAIVPLLPGDLIFTGTMGGVGVFRKPPRFLTPGDEVTTDVAGLVLRNKCVAAQAS